MKEHEFKLIRTGDPTEEQADGVYGVLDDDTIITFAGVPQIHFHFRALSLENAIRLA